MTPDLTTDLRKQVTAAEADLRARSERTDLPWAVDLRAEYDAAFAAGRTGLSWSEWRDGEIAQGAVAWVLGSVFVRFCEDNDLVAGRWIAGRGEGLRLAVDAESAFYAADPRRGTGDWLRAAFGHLADLPATGGVLDRDHSLVWSVPLGDDLCREILGYWRQTGPDGQPIRALDSADLDTRFLGDLYQDLSELAKKKYALLQTPTFVEEFILDRTLTPALAEFGLPGLRLIDPTCGSGHFLLGAFERLLAAWREREPAAPAGEHVRRALDSVHGVDLNPFAVAIARFRLVVAALRAAGYTRLADAPAYDLHLAVGDSLLGGVAQGALFDDSGAATFHYRNEDIHEHPGILTAGRYHVVVGNPPYITVKDKALNEAYRAVYKTCHRQYALSVPFMELFFKLAIRGSADMAAGFVGQITSNSFMKREFGTKVIESLLSGADPLNPVDLLDVIDSEGAWIPGHNMDGTPTVILVGRRRRPIAPTVRAVLGKTLRESRQVGDMGEGPYWRSIVEHIDTPGFDGSYVTITDLDRALLRTHPWSLSGGGAGDVKTSLDAAPGLLREVIDGTGRTTHTGADEAFFLSDSAPKTYGLVDDCVPVVLGEEVRDYALEPHNATLFPYDAQGEPIDPSEAALRTYWPRRRILETQRDFMQTKAERSLRWIDHSMFFAERYRTALSIAFAFIATHNHFVLDRGGKVFNRSAPVIKLPAGTSVDDHLALLGVLNSSAACFWLKETAQPKGGAADAEWSRTYEFTGTKLEEFPLPRVLPFAYGRALDALALNLAELAPAGVCATGAPTRAGLPEAQVEYARVRARMVALQEELDWAVYAAYGLIDESLTMPNLDDVPGIALGHRAFEVVLARRVAAGEESTAWFARHGSVPITDLPADWPAEYRAIVQRRLDAIASNSAIRLLERPEFKRRWASESWEAMETRAVSEWILARLEEPSLWSDASGPRVLSTAQLAAAVRHDSDLVEAARTLTGEQDPNLAALVGKLVADQAVPYLSALRYTDSGLRKRAEWEAVWALQRREDAGEQVQIPVPPKYTNKDFTKASYWQARGKLDVPKERFVSYPGAEPSGDGSLVVGWAGWDHAEQARALARLIVERVNAEGWGADRVTPLLAGLAELEPWLFQWHDEPVPGFQASPARAIRGLLDARLAALSLTRADVTRWRPPAPARGRRTAR
jgi:hypothetical protein